MMRSFALIIATGADRHATLDRLLFTLETALHVDGNPALHITCRPLSGC